MTKLTREQVEQIVREAKKRGERPDLTELNLLGVDFNGMNLSEVNLRGVDLSGVSPLLIAISETDFGKTNPIPADFEGAILIEANLSNADLKGSNLIKADLYKANLNGATLDDAHCIKANFTEADLSRASLSGADLHEADLFRTNLRGADLFGINLRGADLRRADLSEANLSGGYLRETDFGGADLGGANLRGADLGGAYLSEAVFFGTIFANVDLSSANGLDTVRHGGPSTIGLDTIVQSKGKIPDVFLRGCGLSDMQIETVKLHNPDLTSNEITDIIYKIHHLLVKNPIQYYSCFISYSSQDQAFAERLHADLQSKGVRCWFAPEDMKIGDKNLHSIDQAIRIHDKLLVILSAQSVASQWVEHEVEHALDLEIERGELVLFPIRLDQAIMHSRTGWAGNIKRGRHIGDFTQWKEHDAYQRAFERLLRDLKTEEPLPLPPHLAAESARHKRKESLQIQLAQHYSNVNKLKEQAAIYGAGAVPLHLLNQIEAEEKQIADIKAELEAL